MGEGRGRMATIKDVARLAMSPLPRYPESLTTSPKGSVRRPDKEFCR